MCDCRHDLADARSRPPRLRGVAHSRRALRASRRGPVRAEDRQERPPSPAGSGQFTRRLGELGIDNSKQVVAYDASGGPVRRAPVVDAALAGTRRRGGPRRRMECVGESRTSRHRAASRRSRQPAFNRAPADRPRARRELRRRRIGKTRPAARRCARAQPLSAARTRRSIRSPATSPAPPTASSSPISTPDGRFKPAGSAEAGVHCAARRACALRASFTSAAPASPPATTCSRWKSPASPARGSIPARGASGAATRRDPSRRAIVSVNVSRLIV